jgi:hypothetical protein
MLFVADLRAGTFAAYGPTTFTRSTGAPNPAAFTFDVLDPAAQYELRITESTASSAVVMLNGVEVAGTKDFNQKIDTVTKPVQLVAHNNMSVEFRGGPSDQFVVTVVGTDNVAPLIRSTVAPPPNARGWNNSDVTVSFTCSDATSGMATCSPSVTLSTPGAAQVVNGVARDRAGNVATAFATVSIDKAPPVIQVTTPAPTAGNSGDVTISGSVTDDLSSVATVTCGGTAAVLSGAQFTCTAHVPSGTNLVTIAAIDGAGNSSSMSLTVGSAAAPVLSLVEPVNLTFVNISPITVRGTCSDPAASVQVNGIAATRNGGSFTVSVPLVEGNNTLTAVARNAAGDVGTGSVEVTLDTTPPRIAVSTPADHFQTADSTISVSGMVNDVVVGTVNDRQAQVTVNGIAAQVANRTFVAPQVPLTAGDNTIQIVARDRVGNSATAQLTVTRVDATQPLIRVVSGSNQSGAIAASLTQPLVVSLTDASGAPVANKAVVFKVVQGNGVVSFGGRLSPWVGVYSDAQGRAQVSYTLGTRSGAGNNRVEATATGFAGTALFSESALPSAPARINVDAGVAQTGGTNQTLPWPLVVVVTDGGNNRLANVPVTFTVTKGGGNLSGQTTLDTTTDSDGRALAILTLGGDPGISNNEVVADIAPGGHPVAFTASAKVAGPESATSISGVVLDNSNNPIVGATVRLYRAYLGSNSNVPMPVATPVQTDAQGQFRIAPAPVGSFKLIADGSTVTTSRFPTVEYDITTVSGQDNSVGLPIYLPVLDVVNRLCVSPTAGGTLTLPSVPGFSFTVAPGSATFPGGSRSGCITVTPVHGDKVPMVPGFGQQPRFVVTIQPVGTSFSPPAQITFPNVDGLKPREVTEMYSYDHDLSTFVAIGTATVSDDGSVLRSDPGVGVLKAGWHCGGNPNPSGSAATCPTCQKCSGPNCVPDPAQASAPCDDHDKCTEHDKCANGACTGTKVDLSGIRQDSTYAAEAKLPDGLVEKVNEAINYIPGFGGVRFKEATLGFSGSAKDCCGKESGKIPYGLKEGAIAVQLSADLKGITVLGPPTITKQFDFGVAVIDVDLEFGVVGDGSVALSAEGGKRSNACEKKECFFGQIGGSVSYGFKATASAISCVETVYTSKVCGGLTVTPAAIVGSITAAVTYNKPECDAGWGGNVTVGKIVFKAELAVDIPGVAKLAYEYELFKGKCFGTCAAE